MKGQLPSFSNPSEEVKWWQIDVNKPGAWNRGVTFWWHSQTTYRSFTYYYYYYYCYYYYYLLSLTINVRGKNSNLCLSYYFSSHFRPKNATVSLIYFLLSIFYSLLQSFLVLTETSMKSPHIWINDLTSEWYPHNRTCPVLNLHTAM